MKMPPTVPVVLFAYARPAHLARVLACLRENSVPLILAFSDGAKGPKDAAAVAEARALLRAVDWCELRLTERNENLGLGRNVLAGVGEVAARHEAFIVWEDDLICVPGTYAWMCAALRHYAEDPQVMSVSAWTHPRVTPADVGDHPYFDARADCWVWGAWARSWKGMSGETALEKMRRAARNGVPPATHGADLPQQAAYERKRNVWAVRWLYHHLMHGGLCLRPPWSMVEHIGFDALATNAAGSEEWANPPLRPVPPVPADWPEPAAAHPVCRSLWQAAYPCAKLAARVRRKSFRVARALGRRLLPASVRARLRSAFGWRWFCGDYRDWAEARAASIGYDDGAVMQRALTAARAVRAGQAAWERDGALFAQPAAHAPLLAALRLAAEENGRHLSVLDFGGAFGSAWWQHRRELADLTRVDWRVVEQSAFVAAGRQEFTDEVLSFHSTVEDACRRDRPSVLLLSSVLQYIETPHQRLLGMIASGHEHVIIDRTPFARDGRECLVVQHTPPALGGGSYPCWLFDRGRLAALLGVQYDLVTEWPGLDDVGDRRVEFRGFHYRRKPHAGRV